MYHLIRTMRALPILLVLTTVSCGQKAGLDSESFFDPPMEIKTSDLKDLGYNYVDDWSWYNKTNGDTAFIYYTNFDSDPIFFRIIDIGNWTIRDSLGIKNFVESKDGTLVSPIFKDSIAIKFFVQCKTSGQLFRCSLISDHFTIQFHYPDIGDNLRSKYRKPTADGFKVEFEKGQKKRSYQTR